MKNRICINANTYLQLLFMLPVIPLLGLAGCPGVDGVAQQELANYNYGRIKERCNGLRAAGCRDAER
jgi:hypothetical protein